MPGPEQPFDINSAIGGLNRTQLEGFIANAKAFLAQPDQPAAPAQPDLAPASPDSSRDEAGASLGGPVLPATEQDKEQQQAGEELQKNIVYFRNLISNNNLVRPLLTELTAIIIEIGKTKGVKELEGALPEDYANQMRREFADLIETGRVYPNDPMAQEIFGMFDEGEAEAIKAIIGQKLVAAGDTPWASSWREYLSPPAADGAEVADQSLRVTDVGSAAELAPQEPVTPGRDELLARMIAMLKSTSLSGDAGTADAGSAPAAAEELTGGGLEPASPANGLELDVDDIHLSLTPEVKVEVEYLVEEIRKIYDDQSSGYYPYRGDKLRDLELRLSRVLNLTADESSESYYAQTKIIDELKRNHLCDLNKIHFARQYQPELFQRLFQHSSIGLQAASDEYYRLLEGKEQEKWQEMGGTIGNLVDQEAGIESVEQEALVERVREFWKVDETSTRILKGGRRLGLTLTEDVISALVARNRAYLPWSQAYISILEKRARFYDKLAREAGIKITQIDEYNYRVTYEEITDQSIPPEIDGDPELTKIYADILQEENGAEMGERFLEAVQRMMSSDPSLDFKTAALRLIKREFREPNG